MFAISNTCVDLKLNKTKEWALAHEHELAVF